MTSKGDKREIGKGDKSNKLKFMEACQSFDFADGGVISESNLMTSLSRSRFRPLPSVAQLHKLIKGLEAWVTDEDSDVDYRRILEAPVTREFVSINGIFPKIVSLFAPHPLFVCRSPEVSRRSRSMNRIKSRRKSGRDRSS